MTGPRNRRKTAADPYSGSGFVMEENSLSSSRRVRWAHDTDSDLGQAIPTRPADSTRHLENHGQSTRTSSTVYWPRLVNYVLTILLFAVIFALVLVYGEGIPFLRGSPLSSTPLAFSLRRYARPSGRLSHRLRRQVDAVVQDALAAHIGRRDYALAADGGLIVSRLTSGPVSLQASQASQSSPEAHPTLVILRDNLHGGRCWAIQGDQAQVGIRTPERIRLTSVTIDHIPREVADDPNQAPRRMRLWGAVDGQENLDEHARYLAFASPLLRDGPFITQGWTYLHLVDFEYDLFGTNHVQTFSLEPPVRDLKMDFGVFVVEILDNWGSKQTCVYRIRLHGSPR